MNPNRDELGRFAEGPAVRAALLKLNATPRVKDAYGDEAITAPFPMVEARGLDKQIPSDEKWSNKKIPVNSLVVGVQDTVDPEKVTRFIRQGKISPMMDGGSSIKVVLRNGQHIIWDGHHRAVAAKLLGQATIHARVINLDS